MRGESANKSGPCSTMRQRTGCLSARSVQCPLFPQKRTFCAAAKMTLFDHLVSAQSDRWRHSEAKRLGRLRVYGHLEFHRYLNWQVGRLLTAQNTIDVGGTTTNDVSQVWSV